MAIEVNREKHNGALDFVKFLAAILIVFHHYQQITGAFFTGFPNFFNGIFYWGYIVELFFFISGYVMINYVDRIKDGLSCGAFMCKRMSRLLPLVALAAFFYILLDNFFYMPALGNYMAYAPSTYYGGVLCALGIQAGWASTNPCVNNPTWYVSVLMLCYAIFWLATDFAKRKNYNPYKIYTVFVVAGVIELFLYSKWNFELPFLNSMSARGFMAFFSGVIFAWSIRKNMVCVRSVWWAIFALIITAPLVYVYQGFFERLFLVFVTCPAIIFLTETICAKKLFSSRGWQVLGAVSYDVYIWHIVIFMVVQIAVSKGILLLDMGSPISMLIVTIVIEIVGTCSYYFLERKINNSNFAHPKQACNNAQQGNVTP